jgi:hypothetical protein
VEDDIIGKVQKRLLDRQHDGRDAQAQQKG